MKNRTAVKLSCFSYMLLQQAKKNYTTPWASIASATFTNPAILAPFT